MTQRMYHWGRGLELRLRREELGLSMDELADGLHVSRRTVQRWEGDIDPIGEPVWLEVDELARRLDASLEANVDRIIKGVQAQSYPEFFPVPCTHLRERIAAQMAQLELVEKWNASTKLVSEHGMGQITRYGYEDPLDTDAP